LTKVGYYYKAKDHFIRRENTQEYILLYCIEGKGWLETLGEAKAVNKGHMAFCDINKPHAYGADKEDPWSIYWFHFIGDGVADLFKALDLSPEAPILRAGERSALLSLIEDVRNNLSYGYSFANLLYASTLIQEFFCYLIKLHMHNHPMDTSNINIKDIISYMRENIACNLSIDDFADYMCISKYHFSRKFKQATGFTPMEYFNRLKIQKACELIDVTSQSIKEISANLGFCNPYYFSTVFKRITGLSPSEYSGE
jgi:AraC-like DNA-binding protein